MTGTKSIIGKSLIAAPFLLVIVALQLVEVRRDDDEMPATHRARTEIERESTLPTPWTGTTSTYTSYPVIEDSGLSNIAEGYLNGPAGYAYFNSAPARKTGSIPETLGGKSGWPTDVWASNLQGPVKIEGKTERVQWEWTAAGNPQMSGNREYPFVYGVFTTADANLLTERTYEVYEHDEDFWWNPWGRDDYLGAFIIDHSACKTQVFDKQDSGWTSDLTAKCLGYVVFVRYRLFCYRTNPAR